MTNDWYIHQSNIHGKGIFAKRDFEINETVCLAFLQIKNTGIPSNDLIRTEFCKYINHQDNGNLELYKKGLMYIAKCIYPIYKDEEMTCDYNKGYAYKISGGWTN